MKKYKPPTVGAPIERDELDERMRARDIDDMMRSDDYSDDAERLKNNREIIRSWVRNPLTLGDLVEVARDMELRLMNPRERMPREYNEGDYRYEKRVQRYIEIAKTALQACRNAVVAHEIDAKNKLH